MTKVSTETSWNPRGESIKCCGTSKIHVQRKKEEITKNKENFFRNIHNSSVIARAPSQMAATTVSESKKTNLLPPVHE